MIANVKARYANGVLTPLEPLDLEEGVVVTLSIDEAPAAAELLGRTEDYLSGRTPFDELYRLALEQIPAALDPAMRDETALARLIVQLEARLSAGEITKPELRASLTDSLPALRGVATG